MTGIIVRIFLSKKYLLQPYFENDSTSQLYLMIVYNFKLISVIDVFHVYIFSRKLTHAPFD